MSKGRHFIVLGDTTTHGGKVVGAWGAQCPETNWYIECNDGVHRPVAFVGDPVTCPRCRGVHSILGPGAKSMDMCGRVPAVHGDYVSCGCQVMACLQSLGTHDSESGASATAGVASAAAAMANVTPPPASQGILSASAEGGITSEEARMLAKQEEDKRTETVEVIISNKRLISFGSNFGHVAIEVNGIVYSQGPRGYDDKQSYAEYITEQRKFRHSWGYVLRVTPEEKGTIENELKKRVAEYLKDSDNPKYDLLTDSCSTNVVEVLAKVGIIAHDPRGWGSFLISPAAMDTALSHSKRLKERRNYAKR